MKVNKYLLLRRIMLREVWWVVEEVWELEIPKILHLSKSIE